MSGVASSIGPWIARVHTLLALAVVVSPAAASAPTGRVIEGVPYVDQQRSPYCVAATAVMVGRFHGRDLALTPLVRTLPVHVDGIAWLDLVDALPGYGLHALVFDADVAELRSVIDAGLPAIAVVQDGAARHAWVVHGYGADGWHILDPAAPGARRVTDAALADRWTGQVVLIRPIASALTAPGLPLAEWAAETARGRAEAWLARARSRPAPDGLALLERALAADPTHVAVHLQRAAVLGELHRGAEACAAVDTARRLARGPGEQTITAQVAAGLGCEGPGGARRAGSPAPSQVYAPGPKSAPGPP